MKIKVFIGCNKLVNASKSLNFLLERIFNSDLCNVDVDLCYSDSNKYEYPALSKVYTASAKEDFYGLYLHCKGSSKEDAGKYANCIAWADYMLYGLLDNKTVCVDYLNRGADLVGSMWYRHFKGNFFWFKSTYIRQLIDPLTLDLSDRYVAEYWASQSYWFSNSPKPKVKNLFYLPLRSDDDFINLKNQKYIPSLNNVTECNNFTNTVNSGDFRVFDKIYITKDEIKIYGDKILEYMNYDCEIERIDL